MRKLDEILRQNGFGNATSTPKAGASDPARSDTDLVGAGLRPARGADVDAPDTASLNDDEPACRKCNGARFVRLQLPVEHTDFGRAFPCSCVAEEAEEERLARLQRYSNLGPLARLTFENLIPRGRSSNPADQQSFTQCVASARDFARRPEGWLILSGPSGAGKTHIAAALANDLIAHGRPALFMVVPDLLDHLRATYGPDSETSYDQLFEQVRNAPILVLDDLGTQNMTPWTQEKLFQLINHRFNAQLPTVFTTNLRPAELPERLRTRLTDTSLARVFEFEQSGLWSYNELSTLDLPLLRSMTFRTFSPKGGNNTMLSGDGSKHLQDAHRAALAFAEEPQDWLVFVGEHGSGKTHLAAAIANHRREKGDSVLFLFVPDLLDHLRRSFSPHEAAPSNHELFERVRSVPLLVLDDLGAQSQSPWADEKLFQLVNYRYNARLPTVFTTIQKTQELDKRIYSRISDPAISTVLPTSSYDFGGGTRSDPSLPRRRGRPPSR